METKLSLEDVLFDFATYVKRFENHLFLKYKLTDVPYNVKGQAFPKKGEEAIEDVMVQYQFHGRGCTFFWGVIEVSYNFDTTSIHNILVSCYPIAKFIETYPKGIYSEYYGRPYQEVDRALEELEKRGVLMTRKPLDLGSFHVNEVWYEAYKNRQPFSGENKNDIDWL